MITPRPSIRRPSDLGSGTSRLEGIIADLHKLDLGQLRQEWTKRLKRRPPRCRSVGLVRGMLAWALQEEAYGGFSADTRRRLREFGNTVRRNGGLGTQTLRLMRCAALALSQYPGLCLWAVSARHVLLR